MNAGSVKTTRVDSSPTPGVSPPDAMHKITYKLTSEFDVTKGVGHTTLDRSINDGPWEPVRQYPSPRASASYATEREAQNALRRAMRADQAAATRLGLSVEIQVISTPSFYDLCDAPEETPEETPGDEGSFYEG